MKPQYTLIIYTPQELNHSSYVQTGLFELAHQEFINVKVVVSSKKRRGRLKVAGNNVLKTKQANPKVSYYKLIDNISRKEILFACDLYDHADQFSEYAFNHCDYVFKRSYESRYINQLTAVQKNKLYPLGLCFGVRSNNGANKTKFYYGLFLSNLLLNLKPDRLILKRSLKTYKSQKRHWKFISTTRQLERFNSFEIPKKTIVFFQTRCFAHEKDTDVKNIHLQRYHIIKLLQKEFPKNFQGGFIPSAIVNKKYQDALSNVPSEPELYLDALKQAKIVIYTRGLANSPAWKMAEYLSQGKVIIAEKLTTNLPVPLTHGKEVLYFETDTELVDAINLALNNEELAQSLSQNARAYFETQVHPTQNIKRILECMISKQIN